LWAASLSEMETAAACAPVALGLNFTLIKQFAPDATLGAQVLVSVKSLGFAPTIVIPVIFTVEWLLLLSIIVFARLVVRRADCRSSRWEE